MEATLPETKRVVRTTPETGEEREARFTRLACQLEEALVERRGVSAERAKLYVDHARGQGNVVDRENELMWLACSFDLIGVLAEE